MKKEHFLYLFPLLILFFYTTNLSAQDSRIESAFFNEGISSLSPLDVDRQGNIYRIVSCEMETQYHTEEGSNSIHFPPTNTGVACLQKIDNDGNLIWSKEFIAPSSGPSIYSHLKIHKGFIYLSGSFEGLIDFDLDSAHAVYPTTYGWNDIFLAKYDLSGQLVWVKSMGSSYREMANPPLIDKDGSILISTYLYQPVDLDPGPNQVVKGQGLHLIKFSPDGDFLWSVEIEQYKDIELFPNGHILLCNHLQTSSDVDPGPDVFTLTPKGHWATDDYLLELDPQGNFVQAFLCENTFEDLAIDEAGNIYGVGRGFQNFDLDLSNNFYGLDTDWSYQFLLKMDRSFNLTWAKEVEPNPKSLAVDNSQNIVIVGTWVNTNDFDPGPNKVDHYTFTMNGHGFYLLQLDKQGDFIDVISIENSESYIYNFSPKIIVSALNSIYFYSFLPPSSSYFNLIEDYIPNFVHQNNYNSFLLKIKNPNYLNFAENVAENILIYPNPSAQKITIYSSLWPAAQVKMFDITGRLIYTASLADSQLTIDISDYERGTYIVHLIHEKDCVSKKIIKN